MADEGGAAAFDLVLRRTVCVERREDFGVGGGGGGFGIHNLRRIVVALPLRGWLMILFRLQLTRRRRRRRDWWRVGGGAVHEAGENDLRFWARNSGVEELLEIIRSESAVAAAARSAQEAGEIRTRGGPVPGQT